jgi:hypothetical protein
MKTKFSHYLLMMAFVFTLFSCTSELLQTGQDYHNSSNQNLVRQLRYNEFKNESPNLFENLKLKFAKKSKKTEQAKNFMINDFSVDAEYVYVSEHDDGKKTYTFTLEEGEKSWYLENYVLNEQDRGVFDAYIIRYDSTIVNQKSQIIGNEEVPKHIQVEYLGQIPDNPSAQKAMYCPQVPFQEYIWVPGVCSSSQQHETGDPACLCGTPGHMDCTPADNGFYIIQYTLLPTDCGGGGATPGNGPGTSPVTTGPYNPHGSGGIPNFNTPCGKIAELFLQQGFLDKYNEINVPSVFNLNHEKVYAVKFPSLGSANTEPEYINTDLPNCASEGNQPIVKDPMVYGLIHDHQNHSCNPDDYPPGKFPSHIDIKTFINDLMPHAMANTGSYANAYSLITTSGGNYMLMYSGTNDPGEINANQLKTLKNDYINFLLRAYDNPNYTQKDVEAELLRFIKEKINKPGLEIYRIAANSATKIEYNFSSPNRIKETPCP